MNAKKKRSIVTLEKKLEERQVSEISFSFPKSTVGVYLEGERKN